MLIRMVLYVSVGLSSCLGISLGQQQPIASSGAHPSTPAVTPVVQAFPVAMEQNITAGKTPVGSKIKAKLVAATLVNGTVIPRNAVFSGEIVESQAKTSSEPSRLSIRIDSAVWKNGSLPIRAYLTQWYYPVTFNAGPDLQYGPEQSTKKTWNGMGQYPDPNSPAYKPFPAASDSDRRSSSDAPASMTSNRPATMKDVESQSNSSGGITLVSNRSNLKLDKLTTYIFGSSEPALGRAK